LLEGFRLEGEEWVSLEGWWEVGRWGCPASKEEGGRGGVVVDVDGVSSTGLSDGEGDGFGYSET